ncbi:P-loop containing nucleoside triphosphate hydrolase protein [Ascodesmis nigricans]|uniref:P-loop containing nucleoside triphosphate hydrolase protein n=1 Tax=Ascodesmis nigricans TaxID=341454 RepID=A0A4V3SJW1_9PEZI|nr:P-loop containing nucleoside triphosphate hydrolase protein [Ascodesmis nigricans]
MVLAESKNRVGLGRALMRSRGGSGGSRSNRGGQGQGGRGGKTRGKGPIEQVFQLGAKKEADWMKIRSITEQNDLDEFLATAELADTDFTAEKQQNIQVVHKDQINPYLLTPEAESKVLKRQKAYRANLTVPRRPKWDESTTPEELDRMERESFLSWRRGLASLQENHDLLMTPFERNLEVWRQLWRVIERSDLVVQIVDARSPLMFRSEDLEKYVKEASEKKNNLLLVNKSDLLTLKQRQAWADYFESQGVAYKFFSAALAREKNEKDAEEYVTDSEEEDEEEDEEEEEDEKEQEAAGLAAEAEKLNLKEEPSIPEEEEDPRTRIITVEDLERMFFDNVPESEDISRKITIGLVGYPNVGKSSTINALMGAKKVSVSATPGKTKHFQTLHFSDRVILCDCPGLVFPNFATTKAELVCNGVLPIDQQREFTGPAALVAKRIPQWFIEQLYGIKIQTRPLEEGGTGVPTGEELLVSYARARGFMKTSAGNPDDSRAARYVLKDYVKGRLLFCHPPPADPPFDPKEFNAELYNDNNNPDYQPRDIPRDNNDEKLSQIDEDDMISIIPEGEKTRGMDEQFFARGASGGGHVKNPFQRGIGNGKQIATPVTEDGRVLTGRKAKTVVAIDHDLSTDEVRAMMGSKKHFKGGKKAKKRLGVEN